MTEDGKHMDGKGFDQRVHDAYEGVKLSAEAEERILGKLLEAQAARDAEQQAPAAPAEIVELRPRRRSWLAIALPAAACLALAFVLGREALSGSFAPMQAADAEKTSYEAAEAASEEEAPESFIAEEAAVSHDEGMSGAAAAEDGSLPLQARLDDGRLLDLLHDGSRIELAPEHVGEAAGEGWLLDYQGAELAPCEAFALAESSAEDFALDGDPDSYLAVRIEADDSFYLARIVD